MNVKTTEKDLKDMVTRGACEPEIEKEKSCGRIGRNRTKRVIVLCSVFSSFGFSAEDVNAGVSGNSRWHFFRSAAAAEAVDDLANLKQVLPTQVMTIGVIKCLYSWLQTVCLIDSKKTEFALGGMRSLLQVLSLEGSKNISQSLKEKTSRSLLCNADRITVSTGIGAVLSYLLTDKKVPLKDQMVVRPLIASIIAGSLWAFGSQVQVSVRNAWSFAGHLGLALWRHLARSSDDNIFGFLNGFDEFSRTVMRRTMRDAVFSMASGFFGNLGGARNDVFADTHTKAYSHKDMNVLAGVALPFLGAGLIYSWTFLCSTFYRYFGSSRKTQNVDQNALKDTLSTSASTKETNENKESTREVDEQVGNQVENQAENSKTTEAAYGTKSTKGRVVDPEKAVSERGGGFKKGTKLDPVAKWAASWLFAMGVQEVWKALLLFGKGFVSYDDFSENMTKVLKFCAVPSFRKSLGAVSTAFSVYAFSKMFSEKVMTPVRYTLESVSCLNSLSEAVEDTIRRARSQFSFRGAFLENFAEFLVGSKEQLLKDCPPWFQNKVKTIEARMPSIGNSAVWVRILMRTLPEMLQV